jgi:L-threonylcarbamoyladenylate synthase
MMVEEVQKTSQLINSGDLILYPTDTIWGIGCDATNQDAVQRIFRIKQREDHKSMLVLVNGTSMLEHYLEIMPERAIDLLEHATKPTTIIYPGARNLAAGLIAKDGSVGIRITTDPFCQQLMEHTGKPIVSTSANISGEPSPAMFSQIKPGILGSVDYVVKWRQDDTTAALPSSIIKMEPDGKITVIRP